VLELASTTPSNDDRTFLRSLDDGHIPENFSNTNNHDDHETKLVEYPSFFEDKTPTVHVLPQNAVPAHLVDALYHATANVADPKPWGTYVTVEQVKEYWNNNICSMKAANNDETTNELPSTTTLCTEQKSSKEVAQERETLAVAAAAHFFQNALAISSSSNSDFPPSMETFHPTSTVPTESSATTPIWTHHDHDTQAHGVAIWALASTEKSQVPYHLDYAEQIRYEYNLIVPPLLAGTLQCSPVKNMEGGDFWVCMDGLKHYEHHGYKGLKSKQQQQPDKTTTTTSTSNDKYTSGPSSSEFDFSKDTAAEWIKVPYRYNQMILQTGQLPHLSTQIQSMEPLSDKMHLVTGNDNRPKIKRVILGFNVFGHDYGPLVQKAPEHSDVFRRKVTLQRVINQTSNRNNHNKNSSQEQQQRVSLEAIHANKGLSKLLVLAKREKVKRELALAQERLDQALDTFLLEQQLHNDSSGGGVSVQTLMDKFGTLDGQTWPSQVDVQVHVNRRLVSSVTAAAERLEKENAISDPAATGDDSNRKRRSLCLRQKEPNMEDSTAKMVLPSDRVYLAR